MTLLSRGTGVWGTARRPRVVRGYVGVVVSGSAPTGSNSGPNLYCAVIVKRVDEKTRAKTSINELLRD